MRPVFVCLVAAALCGCATSGTERAALPAAPQTPVAIAGPAPAVSQRAFSAIVVDARNGRIVHQDRADELRYPASLTKMMTLYMVFEQLAAGRLKVNSPLSVSANAASRPPSKIGVKAGTVITVDTAARALAVRSANDVAVVVAENLAGSEAAFAAAMTQRARALGMTRTRFVNASGLPDPNQVTTARDIAILGKALSDKYPKWFAYFSTREFSYNGRKWRNTNRLLRSVDGMNGIKTGYIRASGYNLAASVRRGGRHMIAVVIGGKSGRARNAAMKALIDTHMGKLSGGGLGGIRLF
ncbi:MAG: D-alanyl-D-alanine carboxypeptidase family protein [Pseudomonadota bacterium]